MSALIVRNYLGSLKRLLSQNKNYKTSEIQQTFEATNSILEQHIHLVMECIDTLEVLRNEEQVQRDRAEINSLIEKLHKLI
jgi:hypothetical protein